jgi:hypothetical protein
MQKIDSSSFDIPTSSQTLLEDDTASDKAATSSPAHNIRKPFKSPMSGELLGNKGNITILEIQALERRVQILKRAVKILAEEDDDILEGLAQKWREKGREIANQLWMESSGSENLWGTTDSFSVVDQQGVDEENNVEKIDDEVGTMLRSLGVPLQALGWGDTE